MNQELSLPSLNKLTAPLVEHLVTNASSLRLGISELENGCRIIDAGINVPGGLEAGRIITEICMGGLGTVKLRASTTFRNWSWHLDVGVIIIVRADAEMPHLFAILSAISTGGILSASITI